MSPARPPEGANSLSEGQGRRPKGAPMTMARFAAVGAGRMGRSIAIAFAYAGHRIALVDLRRRDDAAWERLRDEARAEIQASLRTLAGLGALRATQVDAIAARIDLV